jgi:hypothetical protein
MLKSEKGFDNIFTDVLNIKGLPHVIACGSPWQLITVSFLISMYFPIRGSAGRAIFCSGLP